MKKVLIVYSYYAPSYKAGGPVQSLVNLTTLLGNSYSFYVYCGAFEMGESIPMKEINPDQWNVQGNVNVYYCSRATSASFRKIVREVGPDCIYINGLFSLAYNIIPLIVLSKSKTPVVVAPRGMLQAGALQVKKFKKSAFLKLFRLSGLRRNLIWHATDEQERLDVRNVMGERSEIRLASNVPRRPLDVIVEKSKARGSLRLVYLSLITEKKNLDKLLLALRNVELAVELDIYGPVKDKDYWKTCQTLISGQRHSIQYKGIVEPVNVQKVLSTYHVLVLPTKGENFSHAIYEALSVGTPCLISPYTPWGDLQSVSAGLTVVPEPGLLSAAITRLIDMDGEEYNTYARNAYALANSYFQQNDFEMQYRELFK
jgi:glycosyltransferase involved in cell wall biosynthesis